MPVSLKIIVGSLITTVALIVGATSLAITLFTSLDTINKVGEAWGLQIANGVKTLVFEEFEASEGHMLAAQPFARSEAPKKPIDLINEGKNWTDTWIPFLISQGVKTNYSFRTYSLVFSEEVYWMYSSQSRFRGAQSVEWIETPVAGGDSYVGGTRYWRENASALPYNAATNFQPEAQYLNIELKIQEVPTFNSVINTLRFRSTLLANPNDESACFWLPPQHVAESLGDIGIAWDLFGACQIKNQTGYVIGFALYSLALDRQLRELLIDSPRSANGNNFIVDSKGYLVASTLDSVPFFTSRASFANEQPPDGCSNSYTIFPSEPPRMGCRSTPKNYGWAPLNAVPESIYLTETESFATVSAGGDDYIAVGSRFTTTRGQVSFNVVVLIPVDDLLGNVNAGVVAAIGAAIGLIVFAVIVAVILIVVILDPLEEITKKMEITAKLEGLDKEETLDEEDDSEDNKTNKNSNKASSVGSSLDKLNELHTTKGGSRITEIQTLEAAFIINHNSLVSFTRYVPKNIVKELIRAGDAGQVTMQSSDVTVSFSDIQNFCSLCEQLEARTLSTVLNTYFKRMTKLVAVHGGIVEKMIGDCIEALWNAPFPIARHELLGSLCSLAMQREANQNPLKQLFADHGFKLSVRCGAATGTALSGNIGSSQRITYTVLGEPVATAAALEPYNKKWGTMIMVGEDAARECNDELVLRLLTRAKLPGRARPILCYEVMGVIADAKVSKRRTGGSVASSTKSGKLGNNTSQNSDDDSHTSGSSGSSKLSEGSLGRASSFHTSLSDNVNDDEGFLPSHVDLDKLMLWHQKRNSCDEKTIAFKDAFNEAARDVLDFGFSNALKKLKDLEADDSIHYAHRTHKSIETLRGIIEDASSNNNTTNQGQITPQNSTLNLQRAPSSMRATLNGTLKSESSDVGSPVMGMHSTDGAGAVDDSFFVSVD